MSENSSYLCGDEKEMNSQSNANDDFRNIIREEEQRNGGHTFVVTTVITDTVPKNSVDDHAYQSTPSSDKKTLRAADAELKAMVPISSSLPSKLLRLHAKRLAHASLQQVAQSQSLDSQFGSDEGAIGGRGNETCNNNVDVFETPIPLPLAPPSNIAAVEFYSDKLIDVGMGSSIDDSEESEVDDELKPLAIDNHVLHDVALSPSAVDCGKSSFEITPAPQPAAILSEANLEKFHRHNSPHQNNQSDSYLQMDNIYLHPNFKFEPETSPPPAVAPSNSPTEPVIHHSFLTLKQSSMPKTAESHLCVDKSIAHASGTKTEGKREEISINEIDTLDPTLIPSDALAKEIVEAVEFYFSNESILKDAFLLKHVRRNKDGFVSLKLISSFKRVRQLTKEWRVVGDAVRRMSQKVELNDFGTKVRRLEPLPNFDETMPSRTVVVSDLPLEKLTIEKVSEIFSQCGEIALIRILKPGMAIPVDVRQFMNKYPEVQQKECALVEFLESSSAREAKNLQGSFQIYEMVAPKKKTGKKSVIQVATPVARMVENYRHYNDTNYERTRGGSFSGIFGRDVTDMRHKLKRFNSDIHPKPQSESQCHNNCNGQQHYHCHQQLYPVHGTQHRGSFGNENSYQFQAHQPRVISLNSDPSSEFSFVSSNGNNNGNGYHYAYSPRRYSNNSTVSANSSAVIDSSSNSNSNMVRRLSNCSDNYSTFSDSRRPSNCSESMPRRESSCSDNCSCSRRISDFGQTEIYRKISQSSHSGGIERRLSNGSIQFEDTLSNASELNNNGSNIFSRRMSNEYNFEPRKQSVDTQTDTPYDDQNVGGGGGGYNVFPRRYSNNFNAANKIAAYDNAQYINGRRISIDSGCDRRYSFGSEYEGSPRSRTGSFLNNYKHGVDFDGQPRSRTASFLDNSPRSRSGSFAQRNTENLIRTPIGPDGSKGFAGRTRKFGQTISPVN